jgi:hypothetical protein
MDAYFFLKQRTDFIRFYYDSAAAGFLNIKRSIDEGLPPYDNPPYSEDGEPAYLAEWMDCDAATEILGLSCVSLLSDSLKLYFQTLQKSVIGFSFENDRKAFKDGFVAAYLGALKEIFESDGSDCQADLAIIEQIVLARNRGQHGGDMTTFDVTYDAKMIEKHAVPFFASEEERERWRSEPGSLASFLLPTIKVTRENLFAALDQVERLGEWVEQQMDKIWEWRTQKR